MIRFCLAIAVLGLSAAETYANISYTTSGASIAQDFNTLSSTTWSNNSTLSGWYLFTHSNAAITTIAIGTGSSATGSFYGFGSNASDRSLGGVGSGGTYFGSPSGGAVAGYIAFAATNNTGQNLSNVNISFNGEQWRLADANPQNMVFEYGFGGVSFTSVTTWIAPGGTFNWTSPIPSTTMTTPSAVDGNLTGLVAGRGGTINTNWQTGETLWLRWIERNDTGSDHGLAIDNFSFSAITAVPEPTSLIFGSLLGVSGLFYFWWSRAKSKSKV